MKNLYFVIFALLLISFKNNAQVLSNKEGKYTEADTLRGSLRKERAYDALKYHLQVRVVPKDKFISGSNTITFRTKEKLPVMQVDLFENMKVDSIVRKGKKLNYKRKHNAVFVEFSRPLRKGKKDSIQFYYSGNPVVAERAPWDGGFVWTEDENGNPWIAVAVQGMGASTWYPNKDHQSDEPNEVLSEIEVPTGLTNVSNGRLLGSEKLGDGYTRWKWKVSNPINNYNVVLNIGKYAHFHDQYKDLDLDYYVLEYNLDKAKDQFEQVKPMMECFYEKMGPYPFPEDGFKLVETPYLGMEHQSAVAYGNHYMNGYLGNDLSGTGHGLSWDYIIIHESGHEWYGNSITTKDIADMWVHEGFTSYTEAIFVECEQGKENALEYLKGLRRNISNQSPIIGDYGVNAEGSGDMYAKGANLLNTIRSIYRNDELWWKTLRDYTETFKHKTVTTQHVEDFFNEPIATNLQPVFDQYLRQSAIPEFQLKQEGETISFRWEADVQNFTMPVDVLIDGEEERLIPTENWQKLAGVKDLGSVEVKTEEFYVGVEKSASE
ncbi:M1 family metallopeptidase [Salegentibacter sp. F188]|uniref:M1 family metallopeptidase n=1 Tax=Autumnicola patrickiae TaxID=3075591 RepID=A0ABU3DZK0_9FLAO|nr:M1 family metallopeptidase [Salegentibacter sp. F188]MDT0688497.1 M1 family metallopeptidase [Salegentibacter sp. F188]